MSEQNAGRTASRPNIILIMADDMGFSDIGCYGSEIQTPNLNEMAAEGVRFTQLYNCARCCPTRASLLTGLYPHQAGIGHMVGDYGVREYQGYLRDDCVTIAEALKAGGYQTYMSGKWHVGGSYDPLAPETWNPGETGHPTPRQRGFDHYYGTLDGAGSYFHPHAMLEDDAIIHPEGAETGDFYYTDAISDRAVGMIDDAAESDDPFFMYVAYTAPHWPLQALPEDIARYEGRYRRGGWDALRTARHEEMKGMGLVSKKWDISPRDEQAPPWHEIDDQDWEDVRMAVYAAQIDRMDQGIGRILDKLRALDLEENTLVMFLADNGGCAEFLREDGWSQRYATQTPDGKPITTGNIEGVRPGGPDTFMSYDLPWANASNAPFRLYKHWVHEGGISTPFIVQWPSRIAEPRIEHSVAHVVDFMATCLDAASVPYPETYQGRPITPLEGESLVPALEGAGWQRERPLFWEHEGNRAVRDGRWKLVSKYPGEWELYDMVTDRTELRDLSDVSKSRVDAMVGQYRTWAARCNVRDWPVERRS
jgi:arylsulfatase A-like enzyme